MDWKRLIQEVEKGGFEACQPSDDDWRTEAAESMCELYYLHYRSGRGLNRNRRVDLRPGSDYDHFVKAYMEPLTKYKVWEALFPSPASTQRAGAIDEALRLLADTKLVDRIYSEDIVTAKKIIINIHKKRERYTDAMQDERQP